MTDRELDDFYAVTGIDTRLAGGPDNPVTIEPALSSVGEQAQADLLSRLGRLRANVEMLEVVVRDRPSDDAAFDAIDGAFASALEAARAAFQHFRDRRECRGAS